MKIARTQKFKAVSNLPHKKSAIRRFFTKDALAYANLPK